ncbi:transmembrane emp24 domain-containing protein 6-like [Tachysurus ichikawai]
MSLKDISVILLLLILGWNCVQAIKDQQPELSDQELFWGADQYDFAIVLPAGDIECFWHFAHQGEHFYLNFMVQWATGMGVDRHLSVTVNAPSGLIVGSLDDATGEIAFGAKETGFYQMCFSNFHNRFGSMQIFMNFGVYYQDSKRDDDEKQLNNTLDTIDVSSNRLQSSVFHIWRYYSIERMRRATDYYLLQSNSNYVSTWSAALSLVILLAGYFQLFFLKSLFNTKQSTETKKPCC